MIFLKQELYTKIFKSLKRLYILKLRDRKVKQHNFFKNVDMYRITECTDRSTNIVSTMYFGFENRTKKSYILDKVKGLLK